MREQVEPDPFRGFDWDALPRSSLPALALVAAAYEVADVVGEQVRLALRNEVFEEGRDVADPAVLDQIAVTHGVVRRGPNHDRAVLADFEEGKRRGVRGAPRVPSGRPRLVLPGAAYQEGR